MTMPPPRSEPDHYVVVSGLTKRFGGITVVNNTSFSIPRGGTLALLGPSGCGKTTILRCLAGLETPDEGTISIAGRIVFDRSCGINLLPEQRGLGVVFQSYAVWPHMTVAGNVEFPLKVRGIGAQQRRANVQRILDIVGLGGLADRPATQLSGGQQQRVAMARALVHEPSVVLFDEALSNLDKQLREQMRLELKSLQDRLGFTAIYVTHDQDEALGLAETLILMHAGTIKSAGPARDVFTKLDSSFSARFFGLNMLPAWITTFDPSDGCMFLDVGGMLLEARAGVGAHFDTGDQVVAGIRREHIALRTSDERVAPRNTRTWLGQITTASFQGLYNEYVVDIGNGLSVRSVHAPIHLDRGSTVELMVDPDKVLVWKDDA
jgi:iron(III) transport system ATP-binding protein